MADFCDDPSKAPKHLQHNKLAPNRQNKLCNYQSSWEVMRNHTDFLSLTNRSPLPDITDTTPSFRYVQVQPRKRVLVFDVSQSMEGRQLEILRQAVGNFILSTVESGSWLGIVQFSQRANRLSQMVEIVSEQHREYLAGLLPNATVGYTSIGAGLHEGLQLLSSVGNPSGGTIILVSDGEENRRPFISQLEPLVLKNRVVVHAFAYGQLADTGIAELANATGGKVIFYSGSQNSTALIDGLAATVDISSDTLPNKDVYLSVLTDARIVTKDMPSIGTFYIDSTIGRDAYLTFSYTEPIQVTIRSPDGPYGAEKVHSYGKLKIIKVLLGNPALPGMWTYRVITSAHSSAITVNIQSKPRHEENEVIQVSAWVVEKSDIPFDPKRTIAVYADVMLGKTPILNASVLATVDRPDANSFDLPLYDNGIGSDITNGDGVYSANILAPDFTGNGRYNVKIKVIGMKDKTKVISGGQSSAMDVRQMTDRRLSSDAVPLEAFQRVTTAGEFRLTGFTKVSTDQLPPARILDFRLKKIEAKQGRATLEWTAVGGDVDRGQASSYIIYVALDLESVLGNQMGSAGNIPQADILRGNLSSPLSAGDREEYVISVLDLDIKGNNTVFLSVVAVDEAGNEGEASNVVTLADAKQLSIGGVIYDDSESSSALMYIGIPVVCVILIVFVILLFLFRKKFRRRKDQNRKAEGSKSVQQELEEKLMRMRPKGEEKKHRTEIKLL